MNVKSVLFGERAAGVYLKSEIFFPTDDIVDPNTSGKIVPAVGAIVVDDSIGLHNQLYVVTAVNQLTYEPTLVPASYVVDGSAQVDRVLSYGNDIFMLYFSSVTKSVNHSNINLTRLIVDNKLSLFGKHAATYQLIRTDDDGNEIVISRKYIAGDNNTLIPAGTSISMADTGVEGIRKCDGCYTDVTLEEGEEIRCNVYTAGGILIAQIQLIAKKAHLLNETVDTANPIIGMEIKGTQQTPDGKLFLFQGQSVHELGIYVDLKYRNGESVTIAIDNRRGFCYGLERVTSGIAGVEFPITVKYYLSASDATGEISESNGSIVDDNITRFITNNTSIKIISVSKDLISKVSPIPIWIKGTTEEDTGHWELRFLRYRDSRMFSPYSTIHSADPEYVEIVDGFNGTLFDTTQKVYIRYKEEVNNLGTTEIRNSSFVIELRDPVANPNDIVKWLIKDDLTSNITYGDNRSPHLRPRIVYRPGTGYRIPSEVFSETSSQSAVEVFLENFYFNAQPPKRVDESKAPTPTHFLIKKIDNNGSPLTVDAVPVEEFSNVLNLVIQNSNNSLVGTTVIVEFIRELDAATCEYLYGVPVEVISDPTV